MFSVAVIQFPGTNCENETKRSLENAGLHAEFVRWNQVDQLSNFDAYVLPGGFAYQDRGRAGIIAAQDAVMDVIKEQAHLGKPVIGICNGCQILVESGLIPGIAGDALAGAVALNNRVKGGEIIGTGFYHDTVYIENTAEKGRSCVTYGIDKGTVIPASVANGEGKFIFDTKLLLEMEKHDQILFKYCTVDGKIRNEFPTTPNGAIWGIAGLCNKEGNVVVYMPHPERMDTGIQLFDSLKRYLEEKPTREPYVLDWKPPENVIQKYSVVQNTTQLFVELLITDNEASTIQLALEHKGYHVKVRRKTHWEVLHSGDLPIESIIQSGELLNANKEKYSTTHMNKVNAVAFLVRNIEDFEGKSITHTLQTRHHMNSVENVRKGTVWEIEVDESNPQKKQQVIEEILQTYILYNPYSQECFLLDN